MKRFTSLRLTLVSSLFFCCSLAITGLTHSQEFTRSTIPLKSGGSVTSIQSQGQNVSYLSRDVQARTADARNATEFNSITNRRETGFAQSPASSANSFYRQAQQSSTSNSTGADRYPYPAAANPAFGSGNTGFNSSFSAASNAVDNGQADLRFDRSGLGDRPSGSLGDTSQANGGSNIRLAQLPQPPTQLPAAQFPPTLNPSLQNPAAALPAIGGQIGPNYVNPAANFAVGYQGYQPQPQAANTVPALNIQFPQTQQLQQTQQFQQAQQFTNPNCCVPQAQAGFNNNAAFQFQPNIGRPQFGANTNSRFSSILTGSGPYTPLIQFRNLPPGTYLGQGIIGQPTAYVDGQPVRNLLRYVAP